MHCSLYPLKSEGRMCLTMTINICPTNILTGKSIMNKDLKNNLVISLTAARPVTNFVLHCAFSSYATEDDQMFCKRSCIDHICRAFLQYAHAYVFSEYSLGLQNRRTGHI